MPMRALALTALPKSLGASAAIAASSVVNNTVVNYGVNPNQITSNGSGFSPQGKAPTAIFGSFAQYSMRKI